MNNKRTKSLIFILVGVIICIVSLTVVYSALSTSLTITGSTDVVASTWDVRFVDVSMIKNKALSSNGILEYNVLPLATASQECGSDDCVEYDGNTSLSFTTTSITTPGDNRVIEFNVVNYGSIDAVLDSVVLGGLSNEQDAYVNYYVRYEDGDIPTFGDSLSSGSSKKMMLVIEFDKNITASQLPTEIQTLDLTFSMNYVQK